MSNTRHAPPGTSLRQNSFASSPDIERGLLGNLVALKCATLKRAEDRELIRWLQHMSHADGGLAALAAQVLERQSITSPQRKRAARKFSRSVDESLGRLHPANIGVINQKVLDDRQRMESEADMQAVRNNLPDMIAELCLNPSIPVADGWPQALPNLPAILRGLKAEHTERAVSAFTDTELSRTVWSEILDTHEMGGATLLHGGSGNGQSFAAKGCCAAHPGRARYALLPATNDATGFWRTLAESVGSAAGQSFKCMQIRDRVIETLRAGDLVLVLDNSQWLFPVSDYRYALPNRVNWVLELVELGVPVVMIADSKIFDTLGFVEARTGWNRNKFVNQLSRVRELPSALPKEDVQTVAAAILPDGERAAQRKLADYMIVAQGYLHSGTPAAQRARRIAARNKHDRVTLADINEALESWMVPAVQSMEAALKRADAAADKCKGKVRNWRPDTEAQIAAKGKRRNQIVTSSDMEARDPAAARLQSTGSESAAKEFHHPRALRLAGTGAAKAMADANLVTGV